MKYIRLWVLSFKFAFLEGWYKGAYERKPTTLNRRKMEVYQELGKQLRDFYK